MSRPGSGNGAVVRGAGFAAAKGALLIALAVIVGVVLLEWVDKGAGGPTDHLATATRTTTTQASATTVPETTAQTTAPSRPARPPAQLRIIVLNGGAPSGTAKGTGSTLKTKGYTNQDPPSTWTGHAQKGDSVLCKAGLEREAATLAGQVGRGATVQPFPATPPLDTAKDDCIVVVGG